MVTKTSPLWPGQSSNVSVVSWDLRGICFALGSLVFVFFSATRSLRSHIRSLGLDRGPEEKLCRISGAPSRNSFLPLRHTHFRSPESQSLSLLPSRIDALYLNSASLCHHWGLGKAFQAERCKTHFIVFPSLRDCNPAASVAQCLRTISVYISFSFLVL